MKKAHTLAAIAVLALTLTGCGGTETKTDTATEQTSSATASATQTIEAPKNKQIGDTFTWANPDDEVDMWYMTLESAEYISECPATWANGKDENTYLLKISYSAVAEDNDSIRSFLEGNQLGVPFTEFNWIDNDGFIQPSAWGSTGSQSCDTLTNRPATELNPGEKTRGEIILEVNSLGGVLAYGNTTSGWVIPAP